MRVIVTTPRNSDYPDPLFLTIGMQVTLGRSYAEEKWQDWIWCTTADNAGWAPKQIFSLKEDNKAIVTAEYNARELDLELNDILVVDHEFNGWLYGYKEKAPGILGWIPKENVKTVV